MAARQVRIDAGAPLRLSWGALFGGAAVAAGSWVLLHALCFAAGLSGTAPSSPAELRAAAIGSGVWSVIVAVVSLFVGGLVAGRSSGASTRGSGALHGVVLWGLSAVGGLILMAMAASSALGTFYGVEAIGRMGPAGAGRSYGLGIHGLVAVDPADLSSSINEALAREGREPASIERIEAALDDAMTRAFHEGRSAADTLVGALVEHTALGKKDAEQVVRALERRLEQEGAGPVRPMEPRGRGKRLGMDAPARGAVPSPRLMSAMLWAVFASMLLSLGGAVAGAMLGVPRRPLAVAIPVGELAATAAQPAPPAPGEKATTPEV